MAQGYRQGADTGLDPESWRRLVDGFDEAVVVVDPAGVVRLANPLAATLFRPGMPEGRRLDLGGGWTAWFRARADFLERASQRLAVLTDRAETLHAIVELAPADHAVVVVPGSRGRLEWWRRTAAGAQVGRTTRQAASAVPGLAEALAGVPGPVEVDALGDLPWGATEAPGVAVSLGGGGALVLFGAGDAELTRRFAERSAAALDAAVRFGERERTVEVLRAPLLPPALPEIAGVRLARLYEPAHRRDLVGGDFYDVHPREDGGAVFVLGDVAGNGLDAAVHAGRVRQSLHTLLLVEQRPARLLALLDTALRAAGSRLFTTLVAGSLVPVQAGGLRLVLAAGGHPAPLVLRADGRVDEIAVHGGIVGVLPEARFNQTAVLLAPGDTLLLYSDGVTEARAHDDRQELFGDKRLRTALADCAGLPAEAVAEHLRRVVFGWLGDAEHDDVTMLVVQAEP
ncbi:SpoIIE family protein phosphatase [Saccharothrix violaceirubra]|uniref:PPM-type phosphatase domain-containing protein n=1 Tax=Saccharothrix violaceirubra TaxID=413306 RepID=A0A7W7T1C6_9PSEU|nr:PP2C family protein-serine/threonine phosphatase [Saccharothrix violaceirubra]MBB4964762.1 hypothetical protein [Saccharothrix violaceirubra]